MSAIEVFSFSRRALLVQSSGAGATGRLTPAIGRIRCVPVILCGAMLIAAFTTSPADAVQMIATQDAWVAELAPTANVNALTLSVRRSTGNQLNLSYLKFDISTLTDDVAAASLLLTASKANVQFELYAFGGFEDAATWTEATLTYNTSPLQFPDAQNVVPEATAAHTLLDQFDLVPVGDVSNVNAKVSELGSAILPAAAINTSTVFSSAALAAFLNTARAGNDATVTLVLGTTTNNNMEFHTKDAVVADAFKPTLDIVLVPEPTSAAIALLGMLGLVTIGLRKKRIEAVADNRASRGRNE